MPKRKKNSFTLVEILVVISIIAILAGMLLAGVMAARDKAVIRSCKTTMNGHLMMFTEIYNNYSGSILGAGITDNTWGQAPIDPSYLSLFQNKKYGSSKNLTDKWGHEFYFLLDNTNAIIYIKSSGPNETDESTSTTDTTERGDDIVLKKNM